MERNQGTSSGQDDIAQGGMGSGMQADGGGLVSDVDAVIGALQGGLTSVPVAAAAGLVGRIHGALQASGAPGVAEVAQSLATLQQALQTGQLDGAGALLTKLSSQVTDVANSAGGAVGDRLRTLSGLLANAGTQLG